MLYELRDLEITPEHEDDYGAWGHPPPNLTEITSDEMWNSKLRSYTPDLIEYRQFVFPGETTIDGVKLFYFYDHTGIIIRLTPKGVKFYKFGRCEHKFREIGSEEAQQHGVIHWGRCYHVYLCDKCGYVEAHDSSD